MNKILKRSIMIVMFLANILIVLAIGTFIFYTKPIIKNFYIFLIVMIVASVPLTFKPVRRPSPSVISIWPSSPAKPS